MHTTPTTFNDNEKTDDAMKRKAREPATSSGRLPDNTWTAQQVADWLDDNGYLPAMELAGVDGEELLGLTKEDLKELSKSPAIAMALYNTLHAGDAEASGT